MNLQSAEEILTYIGISIELIDHTLSLGYPSEYFQKQRWAFESEWTEQHGGPHLISQFVRQDSWEVISR